MRYRNCWQDFAFGFASKNTLVLLPVKELLHFLNYCTFFFGGWSFFILSSEDNGLKQKVEGETSHWSHTNKICRLKKKPHEATSFLGNNSVTQKGNLIVKASIDRQGGASLNCCKNRLNIWLFSTLTFEVWKINFPLSIRFVNKM